MVQIDVFSVGDVFCRGAPPQLPTPLLQMATPTDTDGSKAVLDEVVIWDANAEGEAGA